MAPAWRIITGHGGQGARPRFVWFSQSRLHLARGKACPPGAAASSSCPVAPVVPSSCRPARQPASQTCPRPARACQARQVLSCRGGSSSSCPGQGLPGLPPGRQRPTGLVGRRHRRPTRSQIEVRPWPPTTLAMSSSQHIQEVSRRARWSHLANERSISTSKGPPPAPAKARFDAMLLLVPCLFPSPPPCSHPFSLTTNC